MADIRMPRYLDGYVANAAITIQNSFKSSKLTVAPYNVLVKRLNCVPNFYRTTSTWSSFTCVLLQLQWSVCCPVRQINVGRRWNAME